MFSRDLLRDLLHHMEWADARVWAAILELGADDARLKTLVVHIHVVQNAFLAVWRGEDVGRVFTTGQSFSSLPELRTWAREYYREAHEYLHSVGDDRLAAPLEMPWAAPIAQVLGRPPAATSVAETVFQVTSHSTYHRGQVNARLRELAATPPLVDYIAWLWAGRPAPAWTA